MKINSKKLSICLIVIYCLYKGFSLFPLLSHLNEPAVYREGTREIEVQLHGLDDGALGRNLIVKSGTQIINKEMFPDTGGWKDANLFKLSENEYLIYGAHDAFQITFSPLSISEVKTRKDIVKNYIGTYTNGDYWTFLDSNKKPYKNLTSEKESNI